MIYMLDTNVCIRIINGRSVAARERLLRYPANEIVVCSIVRAELFYGAAKSRKPERPIRSSSRRLDRRPRRAKVAGEPGTKSAMRAVQRGRKSRDGIFPWLKLVRASGRQVTPKGC